MCKWFNNDTINNTSNNNASSNNNNKNNNRSELRSAVLAQPQSMGIRETRKHKDSISHIHLLQHKQLQL